jgi:hypothetical protein
VRAPTLVVRLYFADFLAVIYGAVAKKIALLQFANFAIPTLLGVMALVAESLKLPLYWPIPLKTYGAVRPPGHNNAT